MRESWKCFIKVRKEECCNKNEKAIKAKLSQPPIFSYLNAYFQPGESRCLFIDPVVELLRRQALDLQ